MGRVVGREELAGLVEDVRRAGQRIVLTNGCFDLLHVGHVRYLQDARRLGDLLVVGVNADESVRQLKGAGRPLVPEAERAEVLAALGAVDLVTIFPEATAERLVELVRPDTYVKGGDYQAAGGAGIDEARLPEANAVRAAGGRVVLIAATAGRSTSGLVERIRGGAPGAGGAPAGERGERATA
jgi:D-beta-D-heptose 7-phosphate kinase/D-beta-D-heptose 1-phosphate adenosyltransferase